MALLHAAYLLILLDLGLGSGAPTIEKPSLYRLGTEDEKALVDSSAPTIPATTAKVVTVASILHRSVAHI